MHSGFSFKFSLAATSCAVALLVASCGGGSGDSSTPPSQPPAPTPPSGPSFSLSGSAVKGVIQNGHVIVADANNPQNVLVEGQTNSSGSFALTIPASANFHGNLVKVVVSGGSGATMTCDVPTGCGEGFNFGSTFPIDSSLSLSSILPTPTANSTETVHVNMLTELSARLAGEIAGNNTSIRPADAVNASSHVANLFGLSTSELDDLALIDISSPTDSSSESDVLRASFLNSGFLQLALSASRSNNISLSEALSSICEQFARNQGRILLNSETELFTLEALYEAADIAAEAYSNNSDQSRLVQTGLQLDLVTASAADHGRFSNARISPSAGYTDLEKAKAYVDDLGRLLNGLKSEQTLASLNTLEEQVNSNASDLEASLVPVFDSVREALEALAEAYSAYSQDNFIGPYTSSSGLDVQIIKTGGGAEFYLNSEVIRENTITLSAVFDGNVISNIEYQNDSPWDFFDTKNETGDVQIAITGQVNSPDGSQLLIQDATISASDIQNLYLDGSQRSSQYEQEDLSIANLLADFNIEYTSSDNLDLKFHGIVKFKFEAFRFQRKYQIFNYNGFDIDFNPDSRSISADMGQISVSGGFESNNENIDLSFHLDTDSEPFNFTRNPESFVYSYVHVDEEEQSITFDITYREQVRKVQLVSFDEFDTFRRQYNDDGIRLEDDEGNHIGRYVIANESQPIYRIDTTYSSRPDQPYTDFMQPETASYNFQIHPVRDLVRPGPDTPPRPYGDIRAFHNAMWGGNQTLTLACFNDQVVAISALLVDPLDTDILGYVLEDRSCTENWRADYRNGSRSDLIPKPDSEFQSDSPLNIAWSARTDVALDNDGVEIGMTSRISPVSDGGTDLTRLSAAFSGRRFETSPSSYSNFIDLSSPISVRNQDGLILTVSEDTQTARLIGDIRLNNKVLATLAEDGQRQVVFTFSDDSTATIPRP